jgi:hypothetical protein
MHSHAATLLDRTIFDHSSDEYWPGSTLWAVWRATFSHPLLSLFSYFPFLSNWLVIMLWSGPIVASVCRFRRHLAGLTCSFYPCSQGHGLEYFCVGLLSPSSDQVPTTARGVAQASLLSASTVESCWYGIRGRQRSGDMVWE